MGAFTTEKSDLYDIKLLYLPNKRFICRIKAATALARQRAAEQVPPSDQARFVEVVETEIMSLHEGNIARYRLRPAEYQAWRQGWR